MRHLRLLLIPAFVLLAMATHAQAIRVIARNAPDSVVLRWSPVSAENWRLANVHGYLVERVRIGTNGPNGVMERLTPDTLRPTTLEEMKQRFGAGHPNAPVVAQALYGRTFAPTPNATDPGAILDGANDLGMRYAFTMVIADLDAPIADAMGLRLVDKTAERKATYLYRVITFLGSTSDTAMVGVNRSFAVEQAPTAPDLRASEQEQRIDLEWDREPAQEQFTAYWIERAPGGGPWERIHERPYLPMDPEGSPPSELFRYSDSTITNYLPHRYRLRGITPFGEVGPAGAEVEAMGRDRTGPPSPDMKEVRDDNGKLVVYWDQPSTAPDLKGFRVEKAVSANGAFLPLHTGLLDPEARTFADTSTFLIGENHYRVQSVDTAGNSAVSLSGYGTVLDSIAPLPPTDLRGSIDTNGVVTVEWAPGTEKDLYGFRVFFANAPDHDFNNITPEPLLQAVFHDTIPVRTLTKRIYYKVVAVDRNYNHSAASTTLMLEKPDVVEPVAPVMAEYFVTDSLVRIHFEASSSDDVAAHRIHRRVGENGPWEERALLTGSTGRVEWVDRDVSGPMFYAYAVEAVDSAGNSSGRTPPLLVRVYAAAKGQSVSEVVATAVEDGIVSVRWTARQEEVQHFVIYRMHDGAPPVAVGSSAPTEMQFIDLRLPGKGSYVYAVKAVHSDGRVNLPVPSRQPVLLR